MRRPAKPATARADGPDPAETLAAIIGLILIALVMLTCCPKRRPCTAPRSRASSTRADRKPNRSSAHHPGENP